MEAMADMGAMADMEVMAAMEVTAAIVDIEAMTDTDPITDTWCLWIWQVRILEADDMTLILYEHSFTVKKNMQNE